MKTLVALIFMSMVSASSALATAQYPDKIVYKGKEYDLYTNPMEPYFKEHPDKRPRGGLMSTALWRGYVATFEFRNNTLVLKDIGIRAHVKTKDGKQDYGWKSVKDEIIPEGNSLLIDWFTGILVLPHGKLVKYVHMGYGSTYSDYIILEVKKGKLTDKRAFNHKQYEEFKEKQYQAYKKTDAYIKQIAKLKKDNDSQEFLDSFLKDSVVNYTSEFIDKKENSGKTIDSNNK